jgi:RNA polymerase sigma factor (sigma-70 family)
MTEFQFEELYKQHSYRVFGYLRRYFYSIEDREDIMQETMLWVWERCHESKSYLDSDAQIYAAARFKALNFIRDKSEDNRLAKNMIGKFLRVHHRDPADIAINEIQREFIHGKIKQLTPRSQFVIEQYFGYDKPLEEIGRKLHFSKPIPQASRVKNLALKKLSWNLSPEKHGAIGADYAGIGKGKKHVQAFSREKKVEEITQLEGL